MTASDGKKRLTDVANTEQILRIIQSIPSPKAEPFKLWLAMVGRERIDETIDPELTIDRALKTYLKIRDSLVSERRSYRQNRQKIQRGMQIIFQDSAAALNPRMSVILSVPYRNRARNADHLGRED
jgi:hypothetical protein